MKITSANLQVGLVLFLSLLFWIPSAKAQELPFEIGEVLPEDFELYKQANDTSAAAVILSDYGTSYYRVVGSSNFQLIYEHTVRIHILKKEGYDYANVEIPYYTGRRSADREAVRKVEGYSHNLVDGKVVTEKISKKREMFDEDINELYKQVKFSIPNVKEGSIIEYTYQLTSPHFVNFKSWYFQKDIPVIRSEYFVNIPDFFNYLKLFQGYKEFTVNETGKQAMSVGSSSFNTTTNRWVQENLPAFKNEKYVTSANDYVVKMEFQLASIAFPGQPVREILGSWDSMVKSFLEDNEFGKQLDRGRIVRDAVEEATANAETDKDKMVAIYDYVRHNIEWDGKRSIYAKQNMKDVLEGRKGNSAEIGVLLTAMLREAGIKADPVLISTRSHGRVNTFYPIRSKFNHVICRALIDEEQYLLSAIDPMRPYNLLGFEDLNGSGLVVSEGKAPNWVVLNKTAKSTTATQLNIDISPDGILSGHVDFSQNGYDALISRHAMKKKGEEYLVEKLMKEIHKNDGILKYEFDQDQPENSVKGALEIETEAFVTMAGERIYLNPMLGFGVKSSPFKEETRNFPIDYGYGDRRIFSLVLNLPEGYEIEEMPKSTRVALPERFGSFSYTASQLGNKLTINCMTNINDAVLPAQLYPYLREFYSRIVEKQAEQVVLKKKAPETEEGGAESKGK